MCGLAGYLDLAGRHRATREVVGRMTAALAHRGPDSAGYLVEHGLGIGFRRLAIVDPEGGDQPIANEDSSVVLFCNGEVFNHQPLRSALIAAGHRFRTRADVEVLVHLYEDLGTGLVHRINGQFAFAIHDRLRGRLVLGRDQVGIIPMFYTVAAGQLVFGSEIKALLRHPSVRREVDLRGLDQVVSLPGLASPRTMFDGVHSLPPGHLLVVEDGRLRIERYWDLRYPTVDEAETEAAGAGQDGAAHLDRLEEALVDAVRLRVRADARYGCYLSGGLDSALVAAIATGVAPRLPLPSFSAVLTDDRLSEREHQQLLAKVLGTTHTEVPVGPSTLLAGLRSAVYHSECPLKESYNVASMALSSAVRDSGLKFVLTGEGADELFAGYVGYKFDRMRETGRRSGRAAPDAGPSPLIGASPDLLYGRRQAELAAIKRTLYSAAVADRLTPDGYLDDVALDPEQLRGRHILHQRSYLDFKLRLPEHLLGDHGDRMALANSVEARYPFLDPRVIECARTMPPSLKLHGFEEKYAVKRLAERQRLPASIIAREKFAFQAHPSPDLLRLGEGWLDDLLDPARLAREGYFNVDGVTRLLARYRDPRTQLELVAEDDLLMLVITFQILLETFDLPHLS